MDLGIIELGINPPEKVLVTAICPFQIIFDRNLFQSTSFHHTPCLNLPKLYSLFLKKNYNFFAA